MGNKDLLPLLGLRVTRAVPNKAVPAGSLLGVDGSVPIHYALERNHLAVTIDGDFNGAYSTFTAQIREVQAWRGGDVSPIVVFDGHRPEWKLSLQARADATRPLERPDDGDIKLEGAVPLWARGGYCYRGREAADLLDSARAARELADAGSGSKRGRSVGGQGCAPGKRRRRDDVRMMPYGPAAIRYEELLVEAWQKTPAYRKAADRRVKAISHRFSLDFIPLAIKACRALGVPFLVAPAEAETQLLYLASIGRLDLIVANDSDYCVGLGAPCGWPWSAGPSRAA